jgi:hypothetical protein
MAFPTAAEAAKQARPKYMLAQASAINEAVTKAIANGRYQTVVQVAVPDHYNPEEDPHRDAAIRAAFPDHKVTIGTDSYSAKFSVRISWIPKTPLPLVVVPPAAAPKKEEPVSAPVSEPKSEPMSETLIAAAAALVVKAILYETNTATPAIGPRRMTSSLPLPFRCPPGTPVWSEFILLVRTRLESTKYFKEIGLHIYTNETAKEEEIRYNLAY